ncbi:3-deoxy-D-manno-octulosonic acid transferase [Arenibaculum sp.]|uniref:3-deoxy-D-manno-octulosonic acid transferase n=1 Tax=Arenibaculum sp. TaxID=2865862 RepID=UPI002E1317F7|nr:3-deoxy-D-manno-octulosonic acid transferase [Arenibaculum sp.]
MLQTIYRGLTELGGPAIRLLVARRRAAGKEDPLRQHERFGVASRPRPAGPLVWCHAASVGESLSLLALVRRLLDARPELSVLVTTGTVTSARLMGERLPERAFHHYAPIDRMPWVRRFLDHWRPDLAVWTESEFWPNVLSELRRRKVPAALINARMSSRSFRNWQRAPGLIGPLLAGFRLCLAQTETEADRLRRLGAAAASCIGNLKYSADPLPADPQAADALRRAIGGRPAWLLASSHPGEEAIAARVHAELSGRVPGLLTIAAPRHPHRGAEVADAFAALGLRATLRSAGALPQPGDDVYVADTMGELGLFYRLSPVVCVGGSLVPFGGHNPVEPAQLGAALVYGPHMTNFAEITAELEAAGGALAVPDAGALTAALARLLADGGERDRMAAAAAAVAERNRAVVERVLGALEPLLAEAGIGARP